MPWRQNYLCCKILHETECKTLSFISAAEATLAGFSCSQKALFHCIRQLFTKFSSFISGDCSEAYIKLRINNNPKMDNFTA